MSGTNLGGARPLGQSFLAVFDHVVGDGRAAVVRWRLVRQRHRRLAGRRDRRRLRLARLLCTRAHDNYHYYYTQAGSVAEWLACWTPAQKAPGSNRSRDAVG